MTLQSIQELAFSLLWNSCCYCMKGNRDHTEEIGSSLVVSLRKALHRFKGKFSVSKDWRTWYLLEILHLANREAATKAKQRDFYFAVLLNPSNASCSFPGIQIATWQLPERQIHYFSQRNVSSLEREKKRERQKQNKINYSGAYAIRCLISLWWAWNQWSFLVGTNAICIRASKNSNPKQCLF